MAIFTRSPSHRKRQLNRHQHSCVDPESASLYYDERPPDLPPSPLPRSHGDSTTATSETIVLGRSRSLYSKKQHYVHCIHSTATSSSSASSSSIVDRWRNVLQHTLHTMTPDALDLHNYQFIPGQTTTGYHQRRRPQQQLHSARPQSTTPTHSPTITTHASLNMGQPSSSAAALQIELHRKDTVDSLLSPPTKKRRKITMILPPQSKHRMTLRSANNK